MGNFSSPSVFMAVASTTITTPITPITTTTPIVKETQELKVKKNLSLSTLSERE
jgi:hypothetical protein